MGNWVAGAFLGLLSLFGLVMASRAHGNSFLRRRPADLPLFGVALIFGLVMRATRNPPRHDDLGPAREP